MATPVFSPCAEKAVPELIPEISKVKFADVGGCDEAKEILGDVVDFLKNPKRWSQAGVRLPRGVLLEGPPGCGKTLLARAVAGETNASFYLTSASEFVEMFVGVGAARVRDTFDTAPQNAPAVIFIDELDAVGRRRGSGIGPSHDEREQTLNQLLVCLDGIESREPVAVIAATNRPDILDAALLRAGRFDRRIRIPAALARRPARHPAHSHQEQASCRRRLAGRTGRPDGRIQRGAIGESGERGRPAGRPPRTQQRRPRREVGTDDFQQALQPTASPSRIFNKLDAVLIESTSQLAEPTGKAVVRVALGRRVDRGRIDLGQRPFPQDSQRRRARDRAEITDRADRGPRWHRNWPTRSTWPATPGRAASPISSDAIVEHHRLQRRTPMPIRPTLARRTTVHSDSALAIAERPRMGPRLDGVAVGRRHGGNGRPADLESPGPHRPRRHVASAAVGRPVRLGQAGAGPASSFPQPA